MAKEFDVIIIGAGSAGLTAGIYSSRAGLNTLILERAAVGGQILKTDIVENYPAFPSGISGFELIEKMRTQAEKFGAEFISAEALEFIAHSSGPKAVRTAEGQEYLAKAIIIATGADPKKLGIKGEMELTGRGISYCATCDGPLFKGKDVVVIGGGDTAVGEAIYLSRIVKKVTVIHRRDKLRATGVLQERLLKQHNVEIKWNCVASEILGTDKVAGIKIKNVNTNKEEELFVQGVFMYVGIKPNTDFLKGKIELDEKGFIITDDKMQTSARGIFACGDVRKNILKQVVVACAEGAQAAYTSWHYLESL